jgi:hypothetical protein
VRRRRAAGARERPVWNEKRRARAIKLGTLA